jgi:signal transduction histidine kinase
MLAKYCSLGGTIEVFLQVQADNVIMEVRDDGVGISAEDLKRLGRPFEQVTQNARLARGGTGLGARAGICPVREALRRGQD